MPNIDQDLQAIMDARYGREVRGSIHDAIRDINIVADEAHTVAIDSQESAYNSAQAAAGSASDASTSANDADGKATLSESWAHGGTGTRQGEDTNNAEYWARQAQGAVVGVASFNGRSGAVLPAQDDYTIGQIKATGTQGQVPTLNAQGKLEMQTPSGGSGGHTIVDNSGTEMTQRSKLKFANSTVTDDDQNDMTVVTPDGGGHTIVDASGNPVTQRSNLKFANSTITDDSQNDTTVITTMSGGMVAKFNITSDAGSTVTVTMPSGTTVTAQQKSGSTTEWEANTAEYGTHTLTATLNGQTATTTVVVDTCKVYMVAVAQFNATITVTYPNSATSCTCVGTNESYTATTNPQTFTVHSADTYTITVTNGTVTETDTVTITTNGQSESVTITYIPDGSTVLPTDDIQTWLNCADIWDKAYTTLSEVLADTTTLSALIADSNAVDYMVRSTTWASDVCADQTAMSYIGLNNYCANTLLADSTWESAIIDSSYFESVLNAKVPTMTDYTIPKGKVIYSSQYSATVGSNYNACNVFGGGGFGWTPTKNETNSWIGYEFESSVAVKKVVIQIRSETLLSNNKIQASNDGSTWVDLRTGISFPVAESKKYTFNINNNTKYKMYRFLFPTALYTTSYTIAPTILQFYGREDV